MAILKEKPATREEACRKLSRMVGSVVGKYIRNHGQDYNDMYQEGMMGVLVAYDKYDSSFGSAFSSYAFLWCRHFVKQYAQKSWKTKNNTAAYDFSDYNLVTESSDSALDVYSTDKFFAKQDETTKEIYKLRKQGFTFQEISESMGEKNLHVVRNKFMKAVKEMEG